MITRAPRFFDSQHKYPSSKHSIDKCTEQIKEINLTEELIKSEILQHIEYCLYRFSVVETEVHTRDRTSALFHNTILPLNSTKSPVHNLISAFLLFSLVCFPSLPMILSCISEEHYSKFRKLYNSV